MSLPKFCVQALREHKKRQFTERSRAWPDWDDHGPGVPVPPRRPMEPDNLRRSWSAIRQTAGLVVIFIGVRTCGVCVGLG